MGGRGCDGLCAAGGCGLTGNKDLAKACADALRDIADRVERGRVRHYNVEQFVEQDGDEVRLVRVSIPKAALSTPPHSFLTIQ